MTIPTNEKGEWKDIDNKKYIELQLDAIFSFSGMAVLNVDENHNFKPYLIRQSNPPSFGYMDTTKIQQSGIISRFFGYLIAYLTDCTGKRINITNYFFHILTLSRSVS